ncbi:MAG: cytochrome-c peroxidase [Bacteroidia bacterium]
MKKIIYFLFAAFLSGVVWTSCQRETAPLAIGSGVEELVLPLPGYEYNEKGINQAIRGKAIRNEVAQLGRVLFYDKALSVNNTTACASCHNQQLAFSDGQKSSRGFMGGSTPRNSMAIFNMATNGSYFWDLRRDGLINMVLDPVQHLLEMGIESPMVLGKKLEKIPYYKDLFKNAYGTKEVAPEKIAEALAEFISSMMANSSKFDEASQGSINPSGFDGFNAIENRGKTLFSMNCISCHGGANFNNQDIFNGIAFQRTKGGWGGAPSNNSSLESDFANIGLEYSYADPGMTPEKQMEIGLTETEQGLFKIPSLRNVALTGPYMHDGRFATLLDVINHYDHGVKAHASLDVRLQNPLVASNGAIEFDGKPRKMKLTEQDKEALIAFLNTLTDKTLITHPRFSNPFQTK